MTIKMNSYATTSAKIYVAAILEACKKAKIADPLEAITNTDAYPRLLKIAEVEFAIGWLNGCAESHGVTVEVLWAFLTATKVSVRPARQLAAPRAS